jgi:hypothetical protein
MLHADDEEDSHPLDDDRHNRRDHVDVLAS